MGAENPLDRIGKLDFDQIARQVDWSNKFRVVADAMHNLGYAVIRTLGKGIRLEPLPKDRIEIDWD